MYLLEAPLHKIFGIVIICERGKHIVRQVRNAIGQEDDRIEEYVGHHRPKGCCLFRIDSFLRILQRGLRDTRDDQEGKRIFSPWSRVLHTGAG